MGFGALQKEPVADIQGGWLACEPHIAGSLLLGIPSMSCDKGSAYALGERERERNPKVFMEAHIDILLSCRIEDHC